MNKSKLKANIHFIKLKNYLVLKRKARALRWWNFKLLYIVNKYFEKLSIQRYTSEKYAIMKMQVYHEFMVGSCYHQTVIISLHARF